MNIREAIYKAGEHGKIRLGNKVFEITNIKSSLCLLGMYECYIFSIPELTSLNWEAQTIDWVIE